MKSICAKVGSVDIVGSWNNVNFPFSMLNMKKLYLLRKSFWESNILVEGNSYTKNNMVSSRVESYYQFLSSMCMSIIENKGQNSI